MSTGNPTDPASFCLHIGLAACLGALCGIALLGIQPAWDYFQCFYEILIVGAMAGFIAGWLIRLAIKEAKNTEAGWFLCFVVAFLSPLILAVGWSGIMQFSNG